MICDYNEEIEMDCVNMQTIASYLERYVKTKDPDLIKAKDEHCLRCLLLQQAMWYKHIHDVLERVNKTFRRMKIPSASKSAVGN